jgi:hypothetical protein
MQKPNEAVKDPQCEDFEKNRSIGGPSLLRSVFALISLCLDQLCLTGKFGGTRNRKGNQLSSNGIFHWLSLTVLPITRCNGSLERPVAIVVVVANTRVLSELLL